MTDLALEATLVSLFERKLRAQLSRMRTILDDAEVFRSSRNFDEDDGEVARIATCGAALQFLDENAAILAEREAEALSMTIRALGIEPDIEGAELVRRWPWTVENRIHRPDLRLPSLLADLIERAAEHDQHLRTQAPDDVTEEEVIELALAMCPERALGLDCSFPVVHTVLDESGTTRSEVLTTAGNVLPDVRASSSMLCLQSENSGRAFLITKLQAKWLYVTAYSPKDRAGIRDAMHAKNVIRSLSGVARGNAQLRLAEVIAPAAIKAESGDATDAKACAALAGAVRKHVEAFVRRVGNIRMPSADGRERTAEEMDEALALYAERLGKKGKAAAHQIRFDAPTRTGTDRWRLWRYEVLGERYLKLLARIVWIEEVLPGLRREGARRPAVVRAVIADRLLPTMSHQIRLFEDGTVRDERRQVVGSVSLISEATLNVVRRGAEAFGSVPGHMLIRGLIHRSNDAWINGANDPRRVVFPGGWDGLLDALGIDPKNHTRVRDIAIAGQCIQWSTPHAEFGGLWNWNYRRGTRAAPGEVVFILGDALTPGYGAELARTSNATGARVARRLVPELRLPPPVAHARERDRGAVWTLHRFVVLEFVDHAEELHREGGVVITETRWREIAVTAGVPTNIIQRTLDAWVEGDAGAPALLERSGDTWTLAEPHAREREFIAEGGAKRTQGRLSRAKSVHARRRR